MALGWRLRLTKAPIDEQILLRLLETIIRHPWPGQSRPASFPGDDLVIFADDKKYLWHVLQELRTQMTQLRLKLHPRKTQIQPSRCGLRFLGYRITAERLAPVPETIVRFRRRLRQLQQDYDTGKCSIDEIQQSLASYWGHFQLARTPSRIRTIVQDFPFFKDLQAAQQLKQEQAEKNANARCARVDLPIAETQNHRNRKGGRGQRTKAFEFQPWRRDNP